MKTGEIVKLNGRRAMVTRIEPGRVYFRYLNAKGEPSKTERNFYQAPEHRP